MTEPRTEAVVALAEARHRGCEMELAKWAGTEELRERYMLHDVSSHIPSSTEDLAALRAAGWDVTPLAEADRAAAQERARLRAHIAATLPEWGVGPEYSRDGIHGWRCEHRDRYGPCDCFESLMSALLAAPEPDKT
jgi:hypothetical protein